MGTTTYVPAQGGGGGSGTVTSVNVSGGTTGFSFSGGPVTGAGVITMAGNYEVAGNNPNFAYWSNPDGELTSIPGWTIGGTDITSASTANTSFIADGTSNYEPAHQWTLNIEPTANAPTASFAAQAISVNLDNLANGFDFNSGGTAGYALSLGFNYQGNASTYGAVSYINMNCDVGNGTDPVTLQGFNYVLGFANFDANVTLEQGLQGYGFQPNVDAAAISGTNFYVNAFYDNAQINIAVNGYQTFSVNPTIEELNNNSGYSGININPTINNFAGNANATGVNIAGTYSNFTTGGFTGVNVTPNIPNLINYGNGITVSGQSAAGTADWNGVNISLTNITTSGSKRGLAVDGGNDLGDYAINASGHTDLNSTFQLVSGQVQQYGHVIGGEIQVPNGTAITGTDVLANNMAFTVNLGNGTSSFTSAGPVAMTTLGFVGQIVGDGTCDTINFCLNGYNPVVNGSVTRINNFSALCIPNTGTGTIDEAVLYYGDGPFGLPATDNWGLRIEDTTSAGLENYLTKLAVGDMANRKTTNASVGIELDSTTKALLVSRMTTTERDALTAVNGMIIYNTTAAKFQGYEAGAWTNLI